MPLAQIENKPQASIRSGDPPISLDGEGEPIYPISHKTVAHPFPNNDNDCSTLKQSSEIAPSVFMQSYETVFEIFEGTPHNKHHSSRICEPTQRCYFIREIGSYPCCGKVNE